MRPTYGIALAVAVAALALASKSVAYPLGLAGIPSIMDAVVGKDPLPKGGVTLIFALWISAGIVIAMMRERRTATSRSFLNAPVLLAFGLLGLMLLRLGASPDQTYGSTKIQLYVADNLVFLLGATLVGTRRKDVKLLLTLTLAVATTTAVIMLVKLLSGTAVAAVGGRFSLTSAEYPIYLGRTSADGVIVAIYMIITARSARGRTAAMGALLLLVAALLAAGSRGPVVAVVIALAAFTALAATNHRARRRLLLVGGTLLGAAIVVPVVVPGSVVTRSLSAIVGSTKGLSSNGRFTLWSQAYAAFAHKPLFGIGTGGFGALSPSNPYPHNIFLEAAAELGLAGLCIVVALIGAVATKLMSSWRIAVASVRVDVAVISALFINALVNALVSGAFQDNVEIWTWGGVAAGMSIMLAAKHRTNRHHVRNSSSPVPVTAHLSPHVPRPR